MKKAVLNGRKLPERYTFEQVFHDSQNPEAEDFSIWFRQFGMMDMMSARAKSREYYNFHTVENKPVGAVGGQAVTISGLDTWLLIAVLELAQVPKEDDEGKKVVYSHIDLAMIAMFDDLAEAMQDAYYKIVDPVYYAQTSEETSDPLPSGDGSSLSTPSPSSETTPQS